MIVFCHAHPHPDFLWGGEVEPGNIFRSALVKDTKRIKTRFDFRRRRELRQMGMTESQLRAYGYYKG